MNSYIDNNMVKISETSQLFFIFHILILTDVCKPESKNDSSLVVPSTSNLTKFSLQQHDSGESTRLRDRWNAFLQETSKELDFDYEVCRKTWVFP